jgi:hypothetical protein
VYFKINAPYNTRHKEMKNKESDVIGNDGIVIIFRVKRSDSSIVVERDSVREKRPPLLIAHVTEFKLEYGCLMAAIDAKWKGTKHNLYT